MKKTFSFRNSSKRRGFSLIELSIVLIIIGLLVAGVTGGASLIKSAQLRGAMSEARGFTVAVNSFFVQFNALPGDYGTAIGTMTGSSTTAAAYGNNDGKIHFIRDVPVFTSVGRVESNIAWQHLKNAAIVDSTFTPQTSDLTSATALNAALIGGTSVPGSKIQNGAWVFDYGGTNYASKNVVIITSTISATVTTVTTAAANVTSTGILTPQDALSVDSKMDDGDATNGKVVSPLGTCHTGAVYNTTNTTKVCSLGFQVDVSS